MPRILVVGDVIDDVLVAPTGPLARDSDTPSRIELRAGGSAANVAAWLGASGIDVDFVGTVGAADVDRHSALLASAGVRPHLRASGLPTGTIVLLLDGDARTMLTSRGANDETLPDVLDPALLAAADHLHLTGYSLFSAGGDAWAGVIRAAQESGATVSVDPSSRVPLAEFGPDRFLEVTAGADVVFPNLDEGRLLAGVDDPNRVAELLLSRYPVVALTRGPQGALVRSRTGEDGDVPAARPLGGAADPTGAGDAFAAGFLTAWTDGASILESALVAVETAALAVGALGARPARRSPEAPSPGAPVL
ncbi:MAG TPA: PfkB family carbohydrate kinase [Naasia sp.]|jgi:sugar/nucleoside kinase (ribokinase family)